MGKNYQHGSIQYTCIQEVEMRTRKNVERFWGIILSGPDKP